MGATTEGLGSAGRVEPDQQALSVVVEHLRVRGYQAPGGALESGQGVQHLWPHPPDSLQVGRATWRRGSPHHLGDRRGNLCYRG